MDKYRVFIDRENKQVLTVVLHDNTITQSIHECIIMPLQDAKDFILAINPEFDTTPIDDEINKINLENGEPTN